MKTKITTLILLMVLLCVLIVNSTPVPDPSPAPVPEFPFTVLPPPGKGHRRTAKKKPAQKSKLYFKLNHKSNLGQIKKIYRNSIEFYF